MQIAVLILIWSLFLVAVILIYKLNRNKGAINDHIAQVNRTTPKDQYLHGRAEELENLIVAQKKSLVKHFDAQLEFLQNCEQVLKEQYLLNYVRSQTTDANSPSPKDLMDPSVLLPLTNNLKEGTDLEQARRKARDFFKTLSEKGDQSKVSTTPEEKQFILTKQASKEASNKKENINSQDFEANAYEAGIEDQRRRAMERIKKLRSLAFNVNHANPSTEFDTVPAYIRRNMELFGNTLTSVENFYSKYTVKPDENNEGRISSINTFLDGKKPD